MDVLDGLSNLLQRMSTNELSNSDDTTTDVLSVSDNIYVILMLRMVRIVHACALVRTPRRRRGHVGCQQTHSRRSSRSLSRTQSPLWRIAASLRSICWNMSRVVPWSTVSCKQQIGETALMWAAKKGHTDIVNALAGTHNANVEAVNRYGWTALMYARDDDIIDALYASGASRY